MEKTIYAKRTHVCRGHLTLCRWPVVNLVTSRTGNKWARWVSSVHGAHLAIAIHIPYLHTIPLCNDIRTSWEI